MADEIDPQTATSGTVADLKDHLDTVQTPEQLEELRKAEEDGKARATALAAIDAKAAELGTDPVDEEPQEPDTAPAEASDQEANVTAPNGDKSADATHDDGGELTTTLAQTPHPEALTDDDINSISGGGLADDVSGPRAQVAEQLVINRDVANGEPHPYEDRVTFRAGPGAEIG